MSVEIVELRSPHARHRDGQAVLVCNTSETAFGPVVESVETGRAFVEWLPVDPRKLTEKELNERYHEWFMAQREAVEA